MLASQPETRVVGGVGYHSVSDTPAVALAARAMTNSRSDRRLR
jgi:hypothetical protein